MGGLGAAKGAKPGQSRLPLGGILPLPPGGARSGPVPGRPGPRPPPPCPRQPTPAAPDRTHPAPARPHPAPVRPRSLLYIAPPRILQAPRSAKRAGAAPRQGKPPAAVPGCRCTGCRCTGWGGLEGRPPHSPPRSSPGLTTSQAHTRQRAGVPGLTAPAYPARAATIETLATLPAHASSPKKRPRNPPREKNCFCNVLSDSAL